MVILMRKLGYRLVKKTKKVHRCGICGKIIPIGSSCHRETYSAGEDNEFGSVYYHLGQNCDWSDEND